MFRVGGDRRKFAVAGGRNGGKNERRRGLRNPRARLYGRKRLDESRETHSIVHGRCQ